MLRRLSIPRVLAFPSYRRAVDIFAPSSSLSIYFSLESIRMIRIIRQISGRTDKRPTCTLVATLVVARVLQRVATVDVRALLFQTLDESVLKKNREKFILFYTYVTKYNRMRQNRTFFSLLAFNILLLDEVPTSETERENEERKAPMLLVILQK